MAHDAVKVLIDSELLGHKALERELKATVGSFLSLEIYQVQLK